VNSHHTTLPGSRSPTPHLSASSDTSSSPRPPSFGSHTSACGRAGTPSPLSWTYAHLPGLALQILPLGRTSHAGLDGPFILLETPEHQRLAYTETHRGSQLLADPDDVGILTQKYAMLRTQALNAEDSRDLLDRLLRER
jgi:Domain of unknown function (DUF5753)